MNSHHVLRRAGLALASLVLVASTGCAAIGSVQTATEADFATIRPGMTRDEVLARFGRPTWTFGVWQENLTILNYRYSHSACTIWQVSVRPDGTVRDAGPAWDTACDGPSRGD
jgi:hypothetical protein